MRLVRSNRLKRRDLFLLGFLLLALNACDNQSQNPSARIEKAGHYLNIQTDSTCYHWKISRDYDTYDIVSIEGSILNTSSTVFFSRLHDDYEYPLQEYYFDFTGYSSGHLEKYNLIEKTWGETELFQYIRKLQGQSSIVPTITYPFKAKLIVNREYVEAGVYRFRLDYFDTSDTEKAEVLYYDYSNDFEIK
jgi:hypothetical protein